MGNQGKNILIGFVSILLVFGSLWIIWKMTSNPSAQQADTAQQNISISPSDNVKGDFTAPITLVEYSDFQCPACKLYSATVKSVVEANSDVRLVYKHFPLDQHKNAQSAAYAAQAAAKQGKFFDFHDMLFEGQEEWAELKDPAKVFESYAQSLKLDIDAFKKDLKSKETADKVDSDYKSGVQIAVDSTPSFYLDGIRIKPQSAADFQTLIDNARAKLSAGDIETGTPSGEVSVTPAQKSTP